MRKPLVFLAAFLGATAAGAWLAPVTETRVGTLKLYEGPVRPSGRVCAPPDKAARHAPNTDPIDD